MFTSQVPNFRLPHFSRVDILFHFWVTTEIFTSFEKYLLNIFFKIVTLFCHSSGCCLSNIISMRNTMSEIILHQVCVNILHKKNLQCYQHCNRPFRESFLWKYNNRAQVNLGSFYIKKCWLSTILTQTNLSKY